MNAADPVFQIQTEQERKDLADEGLGIQTHLVVGRWYFWVETWHDILGPFDTEEIARAKLKRYGETL